METYGHVQEPHLSLSRKDETEEMVRWRPVNIIRFAWLNRFSGLQDTKVFFRKASFAVSTESIPDAEGTPT